MSQEEQVAKAFVDYYYATFDRNRQELLPLYRDHSMLTFEGRHAACDDPVLMLGPILVMVTGRLLVDEEKNPMQFSQSFQLIPENGSYYVFNEAVPRPNRPTIENMPKNTAKVHAAKSHRKPVPQNIDQLLIDVLLQDKAELLNIICHSTSTLVGDSAAIASKGILKILSARMEKGEPEVFIKELLKNRIMDYPYARSEGSSYLSQTLTQPLNSSYALLSQCEVDPQKLGKPGADGTVPSPAEIEKTIVQNRKNLQQVCEKVFKHIFDSRKKIPSTILDMCTFLSGVIEDVSSIDAPLDTVMSDSPMSFGNVEKSSSSVNSARPSTASGKFGFLGLKKKQESKESLSAPTIQTNVSLIENVAVGNQYLNNHSFSASEAEAIKRGSQVTPAPVAQPPAEKKNTSPLKNMISYEPSMESSEASPEAQIQSKQADDGPRRGHELKPSSVMGNLSVAEKIVGSFLFLRFIVPGRRRRLTAGITSPEANGILMEKITPQVRRGLVLCGKMLTSLCNDTEFGHKDMSLMACNDFLAMYRYRMKEYLAKSILNEVWCSGLTQCLFADLKRPATSRSATGVSVVVSKPEVSSPLSLPQTSSLRDCLKDDSPPHLRSSSQPLSMDSVEQPEPKQPVSKQPLHSLSLDNLKPTAPKRRSETKLAIQEKDTDLGALFQALYKSLEKLERDIVERKRLLSAENGEKLTKSFSDLKLYLTSGGYAPESEQLTLKTKKSWWIKFAAIFKNKA
ncbi:Nuclear transport factor 2 [Kappamyces sp. JEL0680]|nr:Nuclear transport factor 2 [Kappamyces sp. JEL0680]